MEPSVKPFHDGRPVYRACPIQQSVVELNSSVRFQKYFLLLFQRRRRSEPLTRARVVNGERVRSPRARNPLAHVAHPHRITRTHSNRSHAHAHTHTRVIVIVVIVVVADQ
jgi:hypothetical protein